MNELMQAKNYAHQVASANAYPQPAPKELGYVQRIEGLSSGLDDLRHRLNVFVNRVSGHPAPSNPGEKPQPYGLPAHLTEAETSLRECFAIISGLNDAF